MPDGGDVTEKWPRSRITETGTLLGLERRAQTRPAGTVPEPRPVPELDIVLEIQDGETTLFEAAINAFRAGEYTQSESMFLEEAARALDTAPQRAAIAYRQAALAAAKAGNRDGSDHWMRLAGREYLRVSEDVRTPLPFIREAAVMAAKCFLSVENLHVATKGLRRAQAIESVLRADDDLIAPTTGIPFRHETTPVPADDGTAVQSLAHRGPPTDSPEGASTRWLGRVRHLLRGRPAA